MVSLAHFSMPGSHTRSLGSGPGMRCVTLLLASAIIVHGQNCPAPPPAPSQCSAKHDIVIVADNSEHLSAAEDTEMKNLLRTIVDSFDLSSGSTQIGIIAYQDQQVQLSDLTSVSSALHYAIDVTKPSAQGGSCASGGLNAAKDMLTGPSSRSDARPVVILIMAGLSTRCGGNFADEMVAQDVRNANIRLIGLGVEGDSDNGANIGLGATHSDELLEIMVSTPIGSARHAT